MITVMSRVSLARQWSDYARDYEQTAHSFYFSPTQRSLPAQGVTAAGEQNLSCGSGSYLQHLPCDELMTRLTLNAKMDLVVLFTIGGAVPAQRPDTNQTRT